MNGDVSVRRGDSGDWVAAVPNAPLLAGDSIAVAPNGRAELQLDFANFVRIAGDSEIRIADLSAGRNQIQLARGTITWRVLRDSATQSEISTPAVAVHPLRLSAVRVEVEADGNTRITVRHGEAEASTSRGGEKVSEGQTMMGAGRTDDPEFQVVNAPQRDAWDTWNELRDVTLSRAQSPRYASPDIYGTEDLDPYGRWANDPAYGNVWMPNVPDTWAPYTNGQWAWEDSYGWTWIPAEPWGWAPFHYGSWYFRTGLGWAWYPGSRYGHYWFHPAMVSFFGFGGGGFGVGFGFGNVGWIALAPFEMFHPWYGPGWWRGGRAGVINNVNANIYSTFRNARVAGGVNAVVRPISSEEYSATASLWGPANCGRLRSSAAPCRFRLPPPISGSVDARRRTALSLTGEAIRLISASSAACRRAVRQPCSNGRRLPSNRLPRGLLFQARDRATVRVRAGQRPPAEIPPGAVSENPAPPALARPSGEAVRETGIGSEFHNRLNNAGVRRRRPGPTGMLRVVMASPDRSRSHLRSCASVSLNRRPAAAEGKRGGAPRGSGGGGSRGGGGGGGHGRR